MSKVRKVTGFLFTIVFLAAMFCAVLFRQQIFDQVRVWQYQPSSEISGLVKQSSMSDRGTFYFYLAHPALEDAGQFNQECRRAEPASALLGCYKPDSETIHIYNVNDSSLNGVEEVTAAHEMLHVAYSRLDKSKQEELSPLLEEAYGKVKTDELTERMEYYERAQPGSRENELHSILATEYSDIGDELEKYYQQYFINRNSVVELYDSYHGHFVELEKQANELSAQLESQRQSIEQSTKQYEVDLKNYNQDVESFNQKANSGGFSSQQEFSDQRDVLISRGNQLKQNYNSLSSQIEKYNADVERINSMGREIERFNNSLDSMKAME